MECLNREVSVMSLVELRKKHARRTIGTDAQLNKPLCCLIKDQCDY